ncbi:hypothetical protein SBA3_4190001 [Candidatus Sulfopaludibacter sp. SbA3]|nr:hypothetical protein SBA3_4190001 [Candidatus Sulfopaludibacter sp. SbA3]
MHWPAGDEIAGVTQSVDRFFDPVFFSLCGHFRERRRNLQLYPIVLANLRAWLEFAPSRNPDAFPQFSSRRVSLRLVSRLSRKRGLRRRYSEPQTPAPSL